VINFGPIAWLFFIFSSRISYFSKVSNADKILIFSEGNGLVKFVLVCFDDNVILWLGDLRTFKKSILNTLVNQNLGNFGKPASTVCYVARASTYVPTHSQVTQRPQFRVHCSAHNTVNSCMYTNDSANTQTLLHLFEIKKTFSRVLLRLISKKYNLVSFTNVMHNCFRL
jgi:hypothetical protein